MDKSNRQFYEFGKFRLDATERRLICEGKFVPLPPKAFEVLLTLVQNSGHLLTREELLKKIWTDTFVDENNLRQYVSLLRKTLNENDQEYIETIPRSGYRFLGEVHEVSEPTVLTGGFSNNSLKIRFVLMTLLAAFLLFAAVFALNKYWENENAKAEENYRQGRALWQTRNGEDLYKATLLLEQTVQKHPNFALGHSALADAYAFSYANWKKAETEANEALHLNRNLGEPHATIGFVRLFWEWRLTEAQDEFKQAVRLSPNYATAHQWYAAYFVVTGNFNESLTEIRQALELEPDSISINTDFCQTLYFAHRYDEALAQCQKTLAINPNFLNIYLHLYEIYCAREMWDEAVDTYFKIEELTNLKLSADDLKKLRDSYQKGGIRTFWQAQAEKMQQSSPDQNCYELAKTYARLGEKEKALYWLKRAVENRNFNFIFVNTEPIFHQFHGNQEFLDLLKVFGSLEI